MFPTRHVSALAVLVLLLGVLSGPAATAKPADKAKVPGSLTGFAFDTCEAPSQRQMDAWRMHSPFWGVGIYIAGMNRACDRQEHLTKAWVSEQRRKGWRLLPLVVGRQASCSPAGYYRGKRISAKPAGFYQRARVQGRADARTGIAAARRLGIEKGILWFDLEGFDVTRTHCRRSALVFVSAWTRTLHQAGYRSGLYSSASSGITAVENARILSPGSYALPDALWFAHWNGRATIRTSYLADDAWWPHRRVHQYRGDHRERHGGVRLHIDSNYLSLGRGTGGGRAPRSCGVDVDLTRYPALTRGDQSRAVSAAQCLLRQRGVLDVKPTGFYGPLTTRAVTRFQKQRGITRTGTVGPRTWTALLSAGGAGVLKHGSGGDAVRRLQRALNAAVGAGLELDGVFARAETRAVTRYQRAHGLPRTGVVTPAMWRLLRSGRA